MQHLAPELRTPPLPVVALVGCPELHKDVGAFFGATMRPPFYSVGLAEPNEAALQRMFGTEKPEKPLCTPEGILKADWLAKQRQRRAAVVLALVDRADVEGEPSSWLRTLEDLRALRTAGGRRAAALLVAVLHDGGPLAAELSPERMAALCGALGLEHSHVSMLSRGCFDAALPPDTRRSRQDAELRPLATALAEAAAEYYSAAGERLRAHQVALTAALGSCPPQVAAATAFKLGALAEFRQDWGGAVASYQAACAALGSVPLGKDPAAPCAQRHAEVCAVAEVVHTKALMLLLHQQRTGEAIAQLRRHLAAFGSLPSGLPLAAVCAHQGWLARQHQIAAELVASAQLDPSTLQTNVEVSPECLLLTAAQLARARKASADRLAQLRGEAPCPMDAGALRRSRYLGQMQWRTPPQLLPGCPPSSTASPSTVAKRLGSSSIDEPSEADYLMWLEAAERALPHAQLVMELLLSAQAAHMQAAARRYAGATAGAPPPPVALVLGAADRLGARLALLLAEQQADAHNLTAARKLLLQAAHVYRREGWDALLLRALLPLRDVCQRLKLQREAMLHSLELATVVAHTLASADAAAAAPGGDDAGGAGGCVLDAAQAAALAEASLAGLLAGGGERRSGIMKQQQQPSELHTQPAGGEPSPGLQQQQQQHEVPGAAASVASAQPNPTQQAPAPLTQQANQSGAWAYTVQHLDLVTALQAAAALTASGEGGGGGGAARASSVIADVLQQAHQQDAGWARLLSLSGGFAAAHSGESEEGLTLALAVASHAPVPLPLESASVWLVDAQGCWEAQLLPGPELQHWQQQQQQKMAAAELSSAIDSLSLSEQLPDGCRWPLQLQSGVWQQLHAKLQPRCAGTLCVERAVLRLLGGQCSVSWLVGSWPTGQALLGWQVPPGGADSVFTARQRVRQGAWAAKVQHVGALPTLALVLPQQQLDSGSGGALVGEHVPLLVRIEAAMSSGAPLPATTAVELSLRSTTADGATPADATLLMAGEDGRLSVLVDQHHPDAAVLQLPVLLQSGCRTHAWRLWLRSTAPALVRVTAVLNCPGAVAATAELSFVPPLRLAVRLSGEAGTHTLVAPSQVFAQICGADGAQQHPRTGLVADLDDGGGQQHHHHDDQSAMSTGSAPPLLPPVPLAVGQTVLARLFLHSTAAAELLLTGVELEPAVGGWLQPLNSLAEQLGSSAQLALAPGGSACLLLQLVPMRAAATPTSMGCLTLHWRRREPLLLLHDSGNAAGNVDAGSGLPACVDELLPGSTVSTTRLWLPEALAQEAVLSARVMVPPRATVGVAFPLSLQLHNQSQQPHEVQLTLQEAPGFVYSGDRRTAITLAPRSSHTAAWTLVAHASGQLTLPCVHVSCARLCCSVLTHGATMHVMPF